MPNTNEYAPPPRTPEVRVTVRGGKYNKPTTSTPATTEAAPPAPALATAAVALLLRLQPGEQLLARLGKTPADLARWQQAGFPACAYRTPDGDTFIDPEALLAGLAACTAAVAA
jgi:hypothetical protein